MKNKLNKEKVLSKKLLLETAIFWVCFLLAPLSVAQLKTDSKNMLSNQYEQCLKSMDNDEFNQQKNEVQKIDLEVNQFCVKQQRNKAQNLAIEIALKLNKSKLASLYRFCTKNFLESQSNNQDLILKYYVSKLRFVHICDS